MPNDDTGRPQTHIQPNIVHSKGGICRVIGEGILQSSPSFFIVLSQIVTDNLDKPHKINHSALLFMNYVDKSKKSRIYGEIAEFLVNTAFFSV